MAATTGAKALREAEKRAAAHRAHVRDLGYWSKVGVRVQLKQVSGLTKKGLLVPAYRFQMPPTDDWGVQASMGWTDYETIGGDTLSRPGAEGLRTISFSTLFLDYDIPGRDTAGHRMGSTAHPVTLHILAREYYGASSKWRLIAHANHDWRNYSPSRHLNLAPKGRKMKLKIPKAPHAAHKDDDKDDKK
jgi:hypothetical protein